MRVIFLDESGRTTPTPSEKCLVVAAFATEYPRKTAKAFGVWRRRKFPESKRKLPEVKFSDTGISDTLRLKTLGQIAGYDIEIRSCIIRIDEIPRKYFRDGKAHEGRLYAEAVAKTLQSFLPMQGTVFTAYCDNRHVQGMPKGAFKKWVTEEIRKKARPGTLVEIAQIDSATDKNMQIADWIAGALAAHLNGKPHGREYFEVLKPRIFGGLVSLFE